MSSEKCTKNRFTAGFTLIEVMVAVIIVTIISSVLIFNHKKFNDNLEITNLSYEVALELREAQVYGVSVKEYKGGESEEERFGLAYGIHFDTKYPYSFIFFADKSGDGKYTGDDDDCLNGAAPDVCLKKINIGKGNKISDICEVLNNNWHCKGSSRDEMNITFLRPEPDARLKLSNPPTPSVAKICLSSPQGRIKEIIVYPTGQISIYDGTCPVQDTGGPGGPDDGGPQEG